jgi:transcriptional regulator with XRE-family HTH domain
VDEGVKELEVIHPSKIGELLRKRRKELGLRLEDLADEHISPSTISNIERGMTYVNEEKVRYIAGKLGVDLSRIHQLMETEREKEEQLELVLAAIEHMIELNNAEKGMERLRKLNIPNHHPRMAEVQYLKGKAYTCKGNVLKAHNHFLEAIRLAEQKGDPEKSNIRSAGYCELSRMALEAGDWKQALQHAEEGLKGFQENGARRDVRDHLQLVKIKCLEKAGRLEEALRLIEEMWPELAESGNVDVTLELYRLRVKILARLKLFEQAVRCISSRKSGRKRKIVSERQSG